MKKIIGVIGPTYLDHTIKLEGGLYLDGTSGINMEYKDPGGTGLCYAVALARLGNSVRFYSRIGNDEPAKLIAKFVLAQLDLMPTWQTDEGTTDYAFILIDQGNHKVVASKKMASDRWSPDASFAKGVANCAAVVLSSFSNTIVRDTLHFIKNNVTQKPFIMWAPHLDNCRKAGLLVSQFHLLDHITLSMAEYKILATVLGDPLKMGPKSITVTDGRNGCDLITADGRRHYDPFQAIDEPLDTNGAGEAFGSAFLTSYLHSQDFEVGMTMGRFAAYLHIHRRASDFPRINIGQLLASGFSRDGQALHEYLLQQRESYLSGGGIPAGDLAASLAAG